MLSREQITGIILAILAMFSLESGAIAGWGEPDIKDIVVCNVYWENYKDMGLEFPRISKFVVTFASAADPNRMESIKVKGPNGYAYNIGLERYTTKNLNGYIGRKGGLWFMGFDRRGFLKDGRYDITLKYKSGYQNTKGRVLRYTNDILDAYLKIKPKFSPIGYLPANTDLSDITLKWSVVPGIKTHYMTRIGTNRGSSNNWKSDFGWVYQDTIFGYGTGNSYNTGMNKGELRVKRSLKPGKQYLWFTEIIDSNNFNKINIAIFLKYQYFFTARK